jgi:hypothetical protein
MKKISVRVLFFPFLLDKLHAEAPTSLFISSRTPFDSAGAHSMKSSFKKRKRNKKQRSTALQLINALYSLYTFYLNNEHAMG